LRAVMRTVRLYVVQDNRQWCEDLPYGDHLERIADLEMQGSTIMHASLIRPPTQNTKPSRARLKQRLY